MARRRCEWCKRHLRASVHPLAKYCDDDCRKYAKKARNPRPPKPRNARPCDVDGCERKHYARGYCQAHYRNTLKYGAPDVGYPAALAAVTNSRGEPTSHRCACGEPATVWALAGSAVELVTDRGTPFSMDPADWVPVCVDCVPAPDEPRPGVDGLPIPTAWRCPSFRRWVAADGKRPIRVDGRPASSTDPTTWANWNSVIRSRAGDGLGIMLGDGLGCYDLDDVTDEQAAAFVATIPERILYVERSMSGRGVHVFVEAPEAKGWRRVIDGLHVERYTRQRFIRVTGTHLELPGPRADRAVVATA